MSYNISLLYTLPNIDIHEFTNYRVDKKYETMNINDLHRYNLTPKKTTLKKAKPPFGLKIFKVKIIRLLPSLKSDQI